MTIEELKQLLKDGKITQAQFDAMAKAIDPNYDPTKDQDPPPDDKDGDGDDDKDPPPDDDLDRRIQSAIDRATNKLGNENKHLKQELERVKREHMTAEEREAADRKEREDALAQREAELQERENRLYAIKAIKTAGLDDGSDQSLALVDFVLGADEDTIDKRVKAFGVLVKKFVKAEVDKTFKGSGRVPGKGAEGATDNPYASKTFNLTRQMELETTNPELAKSLKAAADAE
jgi:uncharacterized protein YhaN